MDYKLIYDQIIQRAQQEQAVRALAKKNKTAYFEQHHIVPRCMGGRGTKENLVLLTAREHFVCHHLLWKWAVKTITNDGIIAKLGYAFSCMSRVSDDQERIHYTSYQYEAMRAAHSRASSITSLGERNPFYGKKHTQETKEKISKANTGNKIWEKMSEEHRQRFLAMARAPKSEEHRRKIGRKGYINLRNIHTDEIIRVPKSDPRCSSPDWVTQNKGKKLKRNYQCPYCGKWFGRQAFEYWHNDYCPQNPNRKYHTERKVTRDYVNVVDRETGEALRLSKDDPRLKSERYKGKRFNLRTFENVTTGEVLAFSLDDPRATSGEWKLHAKHRNRKWINVKTRELLVTDTNDPRIQGIEWTEQTEKSEWVNPYTGEYKKFNDLSEDLLTSSVWYPIHMNMPFLYNIHTREFRYGEHVNSDWYYPIQHWYKIVNPQTMEVLNVPIATRDKMLDEGWISCIDYGKQHGCRHYILKDLRLDKYILVAYNDNRRKDTKNFRSVTFRRNKEIVK